MIKTFAAAAVLMFTLTSQAQSNCASSVAQLRELAGDVSLPMRWIEQGASKTLTLSITNNSGQIHINLQAPRGNWASGKGTICKLSDTRYVANLSGGLQWGPEVSGLVRTFAGRVSTINLTLSPDKRELRVKAKSYSGTYLPH